MSMFGRKRLRAWRTIAVAALAGLFVLSGVASAFAYVAHPAYPNDPNVRAFNLWENRSGVPLYGPAQWGSQCVEYVDRFYYFAMGYRGGARTDARYWTGNANQYYGSAAAKGLDRFANGGTVRPIAGDVLCWGGGANGHVAIVISASDNGVRVIQQNAPVGRASIMTYPASVAGGRYTVNGAALGRGYYVQGWLRARGAAPVTPPPATVQPPAPAPAQQLWIASAVVRGNAPGSWAVGTAGYRAVGFSVQTGLWNVRVRTGPGTQFSVAKVIPGNTWVRCVGWQHGTVLTDAFIGTKDGRWYRIQ